MKDITPLVLLVSTAVFSCETKQDRSHSRLPFLRLNGVPVHQTQQAMEVCDEILDGFEILVFVHPSRLLSCAVATSPLHRGRERKTSIWTCEKEKSGVKLKTEDVPVYFSLALQERGQDLEAEGSEN